MILRRTNRALYIALASLLFSSAAFGNDSFSIWVPKMLIAEESTEKNPIFVASKGANSQNILNTFNAALKKYYPDAKNEIDKKNIKNTFAAYLKISRASVYEEQKSGSSIKSYTLPVTASLNFLNMANGDILYSHSYTDITQGDLSAIGAEKTKKLADWYTASYQRLFEHLAKEASQNFKPQKLSAKVIGLEGGLLILDKGLDGGIAKGDTLARENGSVEVLYSTNGYSIGQDEFPQYLTKEGDTLIKTYNGTLDGIKKPRVTLLDIDIDKKIQETPPEQMLYEIFSDKIAQSGAFALVSIGKDFYAAKRDIISKSGVRVLEGKRSVPDYFLRLYFDGPFGYTAPTNVDYTKQKTYYVGACGELVDASGRVFHSDCAFEEIVDVVAHGKGQSKSARFETVMKNATLKLAESFSKGVSFDKVAYKIKSVNGLKIEFEDDKNLLAPGATITIYKNIGSVGDKKNILIPLQEAVINEKSDTMVKATLDSLKISQKLSVERGDIVAEDVIASSAPSDAKLFSLCDKPSKMDAININGFDETARYLIKKSFKYPLYDANGLSAALKRNIDDTKFDKTPIVTTPSTKYCLQPVHWLEVKSKKPSQTKGFEALSCDITGGFRVYEAQEIKNKSLKDAVFKSKKSFETNPTFDMPIGQEREFLRVQLLKDVIMSFESAVSAIDIP